MAIRDPRRLAFIRHIRATRGDGRKGQVKYGINVTLHEGCVIDCEGYGFERNEKGEWEKFPHFGGVEIGDNVEIGANTCIARGTFENTKIGNGVKIDNLVHISHNVVVEDNCYISVGAIILGSVTLKRGCYVAPGAIIREHLTVGEGAVVGIGAVVTKDVAPYMLVIGNPARPVEKIERRLGEI